MPFLSFWLGYIVFNKLLTPTYITTPDLVGKNINTVISILTKHQLNPRIITQKEDNDLDEGTVLSQQPQTGQTIRPHTSIFLITSKKSPITSTPSCIGLSSHEYEQLLKKLHIKYKTYFIPSMTNAGICIGQLMNPATTITNTHITLYVSSGKNQLLLFPRLIGLPITQVKEFFQEQGIRPPEIIHTQNPNQEHICNNCTVIEQKPMPGSYINFNNPPQVYLQIKEQS